MSNISKEIFLKTLFQNFFLCCKHYIILIKPRVILLVTFTAVVGLLVSSKSIDIFHSTIIILSICIGSASASVLNMWYDADIDAIMSRTRSRPIPSGDIQPNHAFVFGLFLFFLSIIIMGFYINWISTVFLIFSIFLYVVIYTIWLKRITPQNIVIGGISGALPPIISSLSATKSINLDVLLLSIIIFLWTPPHFWALSLLIKDDYESANIPMLPNIRGEKFTKDQIFNYSIIMSIFSIFPYFIGLSNLIFQILLFILSFIFVVFAWKLKIEDNQEKALFLSKNLFYFSIFYLFTFFLIILLDNLIFHRIL